MPGIGFCARAASLASLAPPSPLCSLGALPLQQLRPLRQRGCVSRQDVCRLGDPVKSCVRARRSCSRSAARACARSLARPVACKVCAVVSSEMCKAAQGAAAGCCVIPKGVQRALLIPGKLAGRASCAPAQVEDLSGPSLELRRRFVSRRRSGAELPAARAKGSSVRPAVFRLVPCCAQAKSVPASAVSGSDLTCVPSSSKSQGRARVLSRAVSAVTTASCGRLRASVSPFKAAVAAGVVATRNRAPGVTSAASRPCRGEPRAVARGAGQPSFASQSFASLKLRPVVRSAPSAEQRVRAAVDALTAKERLQAL